MGLDRRNFLKTMGVAGITLMAGRSMANSNPENAGVEFHALLYDSTKCIGCRGCETACAEAHGLPEPQDEMVAGVIRKTSETQRCVINAYTYEDREIYSRHQCMHCNEPACVAACLTQAMYKTKEGPVIWRADKCMGCRYCMVSCPFDIPKFEYHSPNPKIEKCDMCYDRQMEGKIPACAEICPDALIFGTRRELLAEARKRIAENPDQYENVIYGEVVAGGTGSLSLSSVPHNEMRYKTNLQNTSYPALSKGFLYSVPSVFVLVPPLLLGIYEANKNKHSNDETNE
jgi:Fe-S-cluster-containing dehydrogenase component